MTVMSWIALGCECAESYKSSAVAGSGAAADDIFFIARLTAQRNEREL